MSTASVWGDCPRCGDEIESIGPLDSQQNAKVEPCGCILSASEIESIHQGGAE